MVNGAGFVILTRGSRVFDMLLYLVENREHVVTRDDLLEAVWGGRIVSESTLASHINAARKAIGDSGQEQRLIRTVPARASDSSAMCGKHRQWAERDSRTSRPPDRMSLVQRLWPFPTGPRLPSYHSRT